MFKLIGTKGKKLSNSLGIVQLPIMIGLVIMAITLPLVSNLVQKNTENRSKATAGDDCTWSIVGGHSCDDDEICLSEGGVTNKCVEKENAPEDRICTKYTDGSTNCGFGLFCKGEQSFTSPSVCAVQLMKDGVCNGNDWCLSNSCIERKCAAGSCVTQGGDCWHLPSSLGEYATCEDATDPPLTSVDGTCGTLEHNLCCKEATAAPPSNDSTVIPPSKDSTSVIINPSATAGNDSQCLSLGGSCKYHATLGGSCTTDGEVAGTYKSATNVGKSGSLCGKDPSTSYRCCVPNSGGSTTTPRLYYCSNKNGSPTCVGSNATNEVADNLADNVLKQQLWWPSEKTKCDTACAAVPAPRLYYCSNKNGSPTCVGSNATNEVADNLADNVLKQQLWWPNEKTKCDTACAVVSDNTFTCNAECYDKTAAGSTTCAQFTAEKGYQYDVASGNCPNNGACCKKTDKKVVPDNTFTCNAECYDKTAAGSTTCAQFTAEKGYQYDVASGNCPNNSACCHNTGKTVSLETTATTCSVPANCNGKEDFDTHKTKGDFDCSGGTVTDINDFLIWKGLYNQEGCTLVVLGEYSNWEDGYNNAN